MAVSDPQRRTNVRRAADDHTISTLARATFGGVLAAAMAVSVFGRGAFGILSPILIAEMSLTRAQIGWLVTAFALTGAVLSPAAGRFVDAVGGRSALITVFGLSAIGMFAVAASPTYLLLVVASLVAGLGQATANPATNKAIAQQVPVGRRGVITGIKQSGVQIGIVLGGIFLPVGAATLGWRPTMALAGVAACIIGVVAHLSTGADPVSDTAVATPRRREPIPADTIWLSLYGFIMGAVGGALLTYVPLFAEERIGFTVAAAGIVVAMIGAAGVVGRIVWGHFSERLTHFGRALVWMGILSAVSTLLIWAGEVWGGPALWLGAALNGASAQSWMAVAMLATMATAGHAATGRASGIVVLGFLAGQAAGPPAFGYAVDATGLYDAAMLGTTIASLLSAGLALVWMRGAGTSRRKSYGLST